MRDERRLFTQQTDQLLAILNRQRHDWLNHVQVLLGYLHLNRTEQGAAHLKRIAELAMQESMVARLNSSLLSVFFLTFNALNKEMLLEVEVCNQVDLTQLALNEQELFALMSEILCTVNDHVDPNSYEPASLQLSMAADVSAVQFRFDLAGKLCASGMEELEKLIRKSEQSTVEVTEWIHTDEEWILHLRIPFA